MSFHFHRSHYNVHGAWQAATSPRGLASAYGLAGVTVAAILARVDAYACHVPVAKPVMSAANRTRQAVMREAWAIKREEPGATFANCLRTAWAIIKGLGGARRAH